MGRQRRGVFRAMALLEISPVLRALSGNSDLADDEHTALMMHYVRGIFWREKPSFSALAFGFNTVMLPQKHLKLNS
jgi:hypothetical protein